MEIHNRLAGKGLIAVLSGGYALGFIADDLTQTWVWWDRISGRPKLVRDPGFRADVVCSPSAVALDARMSCKRVEAVMTDDEDHLVVRLTTGEEVWIGFDRDTGAPRFIKQDVRLTLPGLDMLAVQAPV